MTAAGQETDHGVFGIDPEAGLCLRPLHAGSDFVHQRVAHETDRDAVSFVEGRLEGKQYRHPVHALRDLFHPVFPPGPYLGADVMQHRDPQPLRMARQAQVEAGVVHGDQQVRPLLPQQTLHLSQYPAQTAIVA